jgi:hypothetical protein
VRCPCSTASSSNLKAEGPINGNRPDPWAGNRPSFTCVQMLEKGCNAPNRPMPGPRVRRLHVFRMSLSNEEIRSEVGDFADSKARLGTHQYRPMMKSRGCSLCCRVGKNPNWALLKRKQGGRTFGRMKANSDFGAAPPPALRTPGACFLSSTTDARVGNCCSTWDDGTSFGDWYRICRC